MDTPRPSPHTNRTRRVPSLSLLSPLPHPLRCSVRGSGLVAGWRRPYPTVRPRAPAAAARAPTPPFIYMYPCVFIYFSFRRRSPPPPSLLLPLPMSLLYASGGEGAQLHCPHHRDRRVHGPAPTPTCVSVRVCGAMLRAYLASRPAHAWRLWCHVPHTPGIASPKRPVQHPLRCWSRARAATS